MWTSCLTELEIFQSHFDIEIKYRNNSSDGSFIKDHFKEDLKSDKCFETDTDKFRMVLLFSSLICPCYSSG